MSEGPWGGRPATRLRAWARANLQPICWLCRQWIDETLPTNHPGAWTLDHIEARANGGARHDKNNLAPAHRSCNSRKGTRVARPPSDLQDTTPAAEPHSRQW